MSDAAEIDVALSQLDDLLAGLPWCSDPSDAETVAADALPASSESLGTLRVPFAVMQRVAPLVGGRLPTATEFVPVRCHDLSIGGFSFFVEDEPEYTELVATIGGSPMPAYVVARVAHCRELFGAAAASFSPDASQQNTGDARSASAAPRFLVGCQFLRRLDPGELPEEFPHDP